MYEVRNDSNVLNSLEIRETVCYNEATKVVEGVQIKSKRTLCAKLKIYKKVRGVYHGHRDCANTVGTISVAAQQASLR